MSNRINTAFGALKNTDRKAFIPYTMLGYPDKATCLAAIEVMIENGATVLEVGLPFSDPMADGPIIENASKKMVEDGFTTGDAMAIIRSIRSKHPDIAIVVLSYFNLAFARGVEAFLKDLKNAGADGVTFVDLPVEECRLTYELASKIGLAPIMLVSPLTSRERLRIILEYAEGYIYLVSRAGITGLAERYDDRIRELIANIKEQTDLPVCVGFGISRREHVQTMIAAGADGVISGSKFVELLSVNDLPGVARLTQSLSQSGVLTPICSSN